VLGTADAPVSQLARYEPALMVKRIAIGVASGLPKYSNMTSHFVPPQHSIIGNSTPQKAAVRRNIHRTFCPTKTSSDVLKVIIATAGTNPFV
jgi:hypothetical protein